MEHRSIQLINTIEISPLDFTDQEYEYPNGTKVNFPSEWNDYWLKCLSDSKLGHLEAVQVGSYFVDITKIKNSELLIILQNKLRHLDLDELDNQLGILCGGLVLKNNKDIIIEPSCCGDIGNIEEWEDIFEAEINQWNKLWIGHPWIFYRRNKRMIDFSDYSNENTAEITHLEVKFKISALELKTELQKARESLSLFEAQVAFVFKKLKIKSPKKIAKIILGS